MRPVFRIRNIYLKITNVVFFKILIIFFIAICIPAVSISTLLIRYSSGNIVRQVSLSSKDILVERTHRIDQRISEIDNVIQQVIFNDNILSIEENNDIEINDPLRMMEVINLLEKIVSANALIDSIYFYDDGHNFVLTDTTAYTKSDFVDKGIFRISFDGRNHAVYRKAINIQEQKKDVITYIKKFSYIANSKTQYFIVNLNYNNLFSNILPDKSQLPQEMLVFDRDKNIIFSKSKTFGTLDGSTLDKILKADERNNVIKVNNYDYVVYRTLSGMLNWTVAYMQPYSSLVQTSSLLRRLIVPLLLVVLAVSFGLAYVFSVYLYKPLGKLIVEAEKYSGINATSKSNGYDVINETLKNLFVRYNELLSKYQLTLPYFQQYFIYGMIRDEDFDVEKFKSALSLMGVNLTHSRYVTVLIDFENAKFLDEIKGYLESYFLEIRNDFAPVISNISESRVVIIIFTDKEMEDVYSALVELKEGYNKKNVKLTISLGKPYYSLDMICMSLREVLKQMDSKFFTGKNEIISSSSYGGSYPISGKLLFGNNLEEELLEHIKSLDIESAGRTLKKITECIVENAGSIEHIKYFHFQIITHIMYSLLDIVIEFPENEMSNLHIFENIQKAETINELHEFLYSLISKCVLLIEDLKKRQHTSLVSKTIDYILKHYQSDLSIEEISRNVFLSTRHISSIFKAETGLTIYDYITRLRMETAKDLILADNRKIHEVAKTVGYSNIQTFLRLFKKFYGMTPVQYRRKSC